MVSQVFTNLVEADDVALLQGHGSRTGTARRLVIGGLSNEKPRMWGSVPGTQLTLSR
jgi:hypothetical protein